MSLRVAEVLDARMAARRLWCARLWWRLRCWERLRCLALRLWWAAALRLLCAECARRGTIRTRTTFDRPARVTTARMRIRRVWRLRCSPRSASRWTRPAREMLTERSSRGQVPKVPSAFTGLRRRRRHWPCFVRASTRTCAPAATPPRTLPVTRSWPPSRRRWRSTRILTRLPFGTAAARAGGAGGTGPAFGRAEVGAGEVEGVLAEPCLRPELGVGEVGVHLEVGALVDDVGAVGLERLDHVPLADARVRRHRVVGAEHEEHPVLDRVGAVVAVGVARRRVHVVARDATGP